VARIACEYAVEDEVENTPHLRASVQRAHRCTV
jgi:hypothetical protein